MALTGTKLAAAKARLRKEILTQHELGIAGPLRKPADRTTVPAPKAAASTATAPKPSVPAPAGAPAASAPAAPKKKTALDLLLDGAVREKFGQARDDLAAATGTEQARGAAGGQIDQVWQAYQQQMAQLHAQDQASLAAGAGAQAQVAQGAQGQLGTVGAQQALEQAQQAQVQGATGQVDAKALNAQLQKTLGAYATVAGSDLAGHAANAMNHLTEQAGVGARQQVQDHTDSSKILGQLAQQGIGLAKDEGALRATKKQELIDKAETLKLAYQQLDQKAAAAEQQAIIDKLKIQSSNTNAELDRQTRIGIAADANQLGYDKLNLAIKSQTQAQQLASRKQSAKELDDAVKNGIASKKAATGAKGKAGTKTSNGIQFTPQQVADYTAKRSKIIVLGRQFRTLLASGKFLDKQGNPSTAAVTAYLKKSGTNYTVEEMNMARDLGTLGHLSKPNVHTAEGYFPNGLVPKPLLG